MTTPVQSSDKPLPPATAFDLLEGTYAIAARQRLTTVGAALLVVISLVVVGGRGMTALGQVSQAKSELAQANAALAERNIELGKISNVNGLTQEQIVAHLTTRSQQIGSVLSTEVDVAKLLASLRASVPLGVTVTSITITEPPPGAAAPDGGQAAGRQISIQANADTYEQLAAFDAVMKKLPLIDQAKTDWSGTPGPSGITMTTTGPLTAAAYTSRAASVAENFGPTVAAPAAPAAPAAQQPAPVPDAGGN